MFPDRSAHPTVEEAKFCQRMITAELIEQGNDGLSLRVTNENLFRTTDNEMLTWQLLENGKAIACGETVLTIGAEQSDTIVLPLTYTAKPTHNITSILISCWQRRRLGHRQVM